MGDQSDAGRHSGNPTEEKVERNLPGPDGRFQGGQTVVAIVTLNRGRIRCAGPGGAFRSSPANLLKPLLSCPLLGSGSHHCSAKAAQTTATRIAAETNAEVQALFR